MTSPLIRAVRWSAAVTAVTALAAAPLLAAGAGVDFPFDRVLGTYENVEVETEPASAGAIELRLSSPENTVTLEGGWLRLEPAPNGEHKAVLRVDFSGEGELVTELEVGAVPSRFEDRVRFPRQAHEITAWVTIESEVEGYRVVARQLPETVQVELESSRAAALAGFCRRMSLFFAGDAACDQLESMLSRPRVPLPKPGSDFLVRRSALTPAEIARLDLYLASSKL